MTDEKETGGNGVTGAEVDDRVEAAEAVGEDAGTESVGTGSGDDSTGEVAELREELGALNERHLRLAAEFDNYRKRNERERGLLATRLQADLVKSLLDVLDDLQRVAESDSDSGAESVIEGVQLVEKKFRTVLENAGLEPLEAGGEPFDPEIMEALMMVPTEESGKDGLVADVFQKGYRFRDVLVRPARVRVWQYQDGEGA